MKKLTLALSTLTLIAGFSNAFATMSIIDNSPGVVSDPQQPFEGKIAAAIYANQNNEPNALVQVVDKKNNHVLISFTGADLTVGAAFLNALGKPLDVFFADTHFTIDGLLIVDNVDNGQAKSALLNMRKQLQSK